MARVCRIALAALTIGFAVLALLPGGVAQARYCGRVDPASGRYFATGLYVRDMTCSSAGRVIRRWLVADGPDYDPPRFHCAVSATYHFRCRSGTRRMTFDVRRYYR